MWDTSSAAASISPHAVLIFETPVICQWSDEPEPTIEQSEKISSEQKEYILGISWQGYVNCNWTDFCPPATFEAESFFQSSTATTC